MDRLNYLWKYCFPLFFQFVKQSSIFFLFSSFGCLEWQQHAVTLYALHNGNQSKTNELNPWIDIVHKSSNLMVEWSVHIKICGNWLNLTFTFQEKWDGQGREEEKKKTKRNYVIAKNEGKIKSKQIRKRSSTANMLSESIHAMLSCTTYGILTFQHQWLAKIAQFRFTYVLQSAREQFTTTSTRDNRLRMEGWYRR